MRETVMRADDTAPQTLREALELGPLAPPAVSRNKSRRRVKNPPQAPTSSNSAAAPGDAAKPRARAPQSSPLDKLPFLGRGVSRPLAAEASDEVRLAAHGLPCLHTAADVAAALGVPLPRLRWLAWHAPATTRPHYVLFRVPKRSGGMRQLAAPHRELARCQRWILRNILDPVPVHEATQGFVRGRSIATNAAQHLGQDVVVNVDLKDFFPSITYARVQGIFRSLGYSPAVATILALLCTDCPRQPVRWQGTTWYVGEAARSLPQGACTSPALSNLAARRLDRRLAGLASKLGWRYSRYADDLSFSAAGESAARTGYLLHRLRRIVGEEDFGVNEQKTRVLRQNRAQLVTGVVVNRRAGVPRKLVRRLRAMLHRASQEGLAAQNRGGRPDFESWLEGTIAYIHMINPGQGAPLRAALAAVRGKPPGDGAAASGQSPQA